ncbi:hypothetical protein SAMN05216480_10823 [Pustulibacterium marinum]|uniref:Protein involved in gliding motility RemB n=1 Tax=Pustulibacterium marinum TaxID=1224947 RepID=A0A1I7HAB0_9FLAO|nr:gliding motility protein RemB [Pustulibacterium marinum]SFU57532.1 hypothetical protein SAMN05216480_10823 [Pustulibacterium marinum]
MKTLKLTSLLLLFVCFSFGQTIQNTSEVYPSFKECDSTVFMQSCFNSTLLAKIKESFHKPSGVDSTKVYPIGILFEVSEEGAFKLVYIDTAEESLKSEMQNVFATLDNIQPATYNGEPTYMQFSLQLKYPFSKMNTSNLEEPSDMISSERKRSVVVTDSLDAFAKLDATNEYDAFKKSTYVNKEFESNLNVPFQHQRYAIFDAAMNAVGTNSHTASKPFLYNEVQQYYDFEGYTNSLLQDRKTWFGRKFWNEHFATIRGKDYWIDFDIVADLRVGKDTESGINTYNNTRAVQVQGGIGKNLAFYTTFYESQGRFAGYFNDYAESMAPDGGNPAIIPGRGIAKAYGEDGYDYPVAEAYLSYSPSKHFNFQFGNGKNFIGDGYRSLLTSDVASPYPFFKINTTFWKLKYTNTWMWLKDVRPEVTEDGAFLTKFMATHYLSWNVSKRLNLGFFESVIWNDDNNRGFDVANLNPVIFYRAIEFNAGSRSGNALMGLTGKYKLNNSVNLYGQFILDELSTGDFTGGEKSWKNKYGFQLGAKYYNAFKVKDLLLQFEYNQVRPYTYAHRYPRYNYGHNNQSMAHLWGANFREMIAIANYRKGRWFGYGKLTYGQRGLDFNTTEDSYSYGGDIYRSYDDRTADVGIEMLQGNKTSIFITELQAGYVINPVTNLRLYGNVLLRNFDPTAETETTFKQSTVWFSLGFRTDLFNWYNDF